MKRARTEEGVITSWLVKVLLAVGLIGVVLFDSGSIAWNYFGVDSRAQEIAVQLAAIAEETGAGNIPAILQEEAKKLAKEAGAKLVGKVEVTSDTVRLKIRRNANTLVIGQIDAISDWGKASATGSATYH